MKKFRVQITVFPQIVSSLVVPSLNSFCSPVTRVFKFHYIRGKLLQQLFEIFHIFQIQKNNFGGNYSGKTLYIFCRPAKFIKLKKIDERQKK